MECPSCGAWSPPDPETGYDADDLCPDCAEREANEEENDNDENDNDSDSDNVPA
jgi:hypothetical protein